MAGGAAKFPAGGRLCDRLVGSLLRLPLTSGVPPSAHGVSRTAVFQVKVNRWNPWTTSFVGGREWGAEQICGGNMCGNMSVAQEL